MTNEIATATQASVPRVLIVSDQKRVVERCKEILGVLGFELRDAVHLFNEDHIGEDFYHADLVIIDDSISSVEQGFSTMKILRDEGVDSPIILIVAFPEIEARSGKKAFDLGAHSFIFNTIGDGGFQNLRLLVSAALAPKRPN